MMTTEKTIENAVLSIVHASDNKFPEVAVDAYKAIRAIHNIGPGIATRLLTLARPDRCISLNNASIKGLIKAYGDGLNALKKLKDRNKHNGDNGHIYGEFLEEIYDQPWYRKPEPENEKEKMIKKFRVALLDCFVYKYGAGLKYPILGRPKLRMTKIVISR